MASDSDREPDDNDFMPESDESSDETVSIVLNNEPTPLTSAGIQGRRGGGGSNRGRGASRGRGGGCIPVHRDTVDDNNTNNSDWIACEEGDITDTPMFTGNTGLKEEISGQRTLLDYFSMLLGNLQTVLYTMACYCFVLLILVCLFVF